MVIGWECIIQMHFLTSLAEGMSGNIGFVSLQYSFLVIYFCYNFFQKGLLMLIDRHMVAYFYVLFPTYRDSGKDLYTL